MNFFEHQRRAKQKTRYLVFLFGLGVFGLILLSNGLAWLTVSILNIEPDGQINEGAHTWSVYTWTTFITVSIILLSALYKRSILGQHGSGIAKYLGGVPAEQLKNQHKVQQALNAVEEMAIAAGTTPPPLYILPNESAINAFAAGLTPQTAVIALSQGCLDHLTRDELQGVIAHELSHIYHGDTRLNVQLLSYLAGIVTIGVLGKWMMEVPIRNARYRSRSSNKDDGSAIILIILAGFGLWFIGSVGVLVGRMIRAAVSRQREFLADAAAVQFTRLPEGIAGALAKINKHSGLLLTAGAEEVSHMCFQSPLKRSFFPLFATHPPLKERIRRVDRRFLAPGFVENHIKKTSIEGGPLKQKPWMRRLQEEKVAEIPEILLESIGEPHPESLAFVHQVVMAELPAFRSDRSESLQAQAITLCLLSLTTNFETALKTIRTHCSKELFEEYQLRWQTLQNLSRDRVLPTLHHCIPSLRPLSQLAKNVFLRTCQYLISADGAIDLNEASLYLLLELHLGEKKDWVLSNHRRLEDHTEDAGLLIRILLAHGDFSPIDAETLYSKIAADLKLHEAFKAESKNLELKRIRLALHNLAELNPTDKEALIRSMLTCAQHDGQVSEQELEFMKATTEYLGVPLPL